MLEDEFRAKIAEELEKARRALYDLTYIGYALLILALALVVLVGVIAVR